MSIRTENNTEIRDQDHIRKVSQIHDVFERLGVHIYGSRTEVVRKLRIYEIEETEMEKLAAHLERLLDRLS